MTDLRYAFRMLFKSPSFTAVAVLALALGIGAKATIFTVVNAVLLRALPFQDPDRLVMVWERSTLKRTNVVNSWNFLDWRARNRVFERISAIHQIPMNLTSETEPEEVMGLNAKWSATVVPLKEQAVGQVRPALLVLLAAVGLVLLIA